MSRKFQHTLATIQDAPSTTVRSTTAKPLAKHFAKSSTHNQTRSQLNPVGPLITTTKTPSLRQNTETRLCLFDMAKRPTTTPLAPETPPKQFEATERSEVAENPTDIEDAPITTNSQSSASNTPASAEEGVTSPTDDVEDTSLALEEDALSPKEKKNKKATTSKKSSVKASTPKKKDGKAVTSKKKGDEASDSEKGDSAIVPEAKESKPPVGDGFTPYKHSIVIPAFNQFWGDRPVTGSARPAPDQPSARASNGQTNPPLFENRGYRYKRGSQLVKHHYTIDPANMASLPIDRDQEELLAVRLIDMRLNRKTSVPKRSPDVYCYGKRPRDWNSKQSIKALNDRRYQAIDRETMDAPWTEIERKYLARLIREDPDASILDLAERHNDRFMGQDYKESTGFMKVMGGSLSIGRTVESVRYQYTAYKPFYDRGRVPIVRWRGDKSAEGIALSNHIASKFGKPSKADQLAHDKAHGGADESDDEDDTSKKTSKHVEGLDDDNEKSDASDLHPGGKRYASDQLEEDERPAKYSRTGEANPFAGQDKLDDVEEELLELAIPYDDDGGSPSLQGDRDTKEAEEADRYHDTETQVESDLRATRDMEVDENYDDDL
ncbi:hypothetical protein CC77DRAFT_1050039 [Alternaria alternata]|uniref:Uncharacterized protein n=1 Tax=Alternaria alternata TaxID=5599 RepID=A0A177DMN0_ALTAL|nr:hypothetical protein CC77DRAFT_1050039 [Alternaria alternata]OAG20618.1 hypothetical protein CC77DRAFT_1050039 [Alternaria alternata]